jgi:ABC-type multidrug transport system fused ATPase/permease subunit
MEDMELTSTAPIVAIADCSHVSPDIIQASSAAGAHEFITHLELGYDTVIEGAEAGDKPLTAAQRQLIGLSRSLMRNPPLLLLDDVTAGLEGEEEQSVVASLSAVKLMRSSGDTTIVVSSKLSSVVHADSIVVVVGGKIVQRGTHQHLLASPGWYADQWRGEGLHPQDE